MSSQGKRKAPNGFYWVNILVNLKGKCVMAEPTDSGKFKVWSNSSSLDETWIPSELKKGWSFKIVEESELTFFDYTKKTKL